MNVVKTVLQNGSTRVVLQGVVNEETDFEAIIGLPLGTLEVFTSEIVRINSVGVRFWLSYFKKLRGLGTQLKFYEIAAHLVNQVNLISDFIDTKEIVSISAPFFCENCDLPVNKVLDREESIQASKGVIKTYPCPKCGGALSFDEVLESFFSAFQSLP